MARHVGRSVKQYKGRRFEFVLAAAVVIIGCVCAVPVFIYLLE
jgi:hypothetical protein